MVKYRSPNSNCFTCGGQYPHDADAESHGQHRDFYCPDCGSTFLTGIISTGGETADRGVSVPPQLQQLEVSQDSTWDTIELWWTNRMSVATIHGRRVYGSEALLKFVDSIRDKYDDSY